MTPGASSLARGAWPRPAALGLCVLAAFLPALVRAGPIGIPSAPHCTLPRAVVLVGHAGQVADSAAGHFEIVARDLGDNLLDWVAVDLEFVDDGEFRIASDQLDPRLQVECASRTVYAMTDGQGVARFTLIGGGRYPPGPAVRNRALRISIDGWPLVTVPVSCLDLNGTGGVAPNDLTHWSADFFGSLHPTRADYDADGFVTILDLSIWGAAYFAGGSWQSADGYCP